MAYVPPSIDGHRQPAPLSCEELMVRASALEGVTIGDIAGAIGATIPKGRRSTKGFIGQLLEKALGADPEALEQPDFPDLGVELKSMPVAESEALRPVESTFLTSISMAYADRAVWETSRLRHKLQSVLWIPVDGKWRGEIALRRVRTPRLWRPTLEEFEGLKADWMDLMGAIGAGNAAQLTGRDGKYIQVRPKAAHSKVRVAAPSEHSVDMQHPLAFYMRASATKGILQEGSMLGFEGDEETK